MRDVVWPRYGNRVLRWGLIGEVDPGAMLTASKVCKFAMCTKFDDTVEFM